MEGEVFVAILLLLFCL